MSINHNKIRPVNINLLTISLPVSAISSITHRLAGIYIFFITLPLFLFLLYFTTKSYNDFMFIQQTFKDSVLFSTFVSFSFLVFAYHILTGVRHLLQDLHIGESLQASRVSSYLVFVLWFLLILFVISAFYLWLAQLYSLFSVFQPYFYWPILFGWLLFLFLINLSAFNLIKPSASEWL